MSPDRSDSFGANETLAVGGSSADSNSVESNDANKGAPHERKINEHLATDRTAPQIAHTQYFRYSR